MGKFSKRKKAKMRMYRLRRVNRVCRNMIGCIINDDEERYEVIDQAKIQDTMYLLVISENNTYAVYKIVSVHQQVRLSDKKVLKNKEAFCDYEYWRNRSIIYINQQGIIESVKPYYMR